MYKLKEKLHYIQKRGKLGLMTHVVVGYPTLSDTLRLVKLMEKEGVDIVELQIPFSDPLADGPTIMRACEMSLANGTKVRDAFAVMRKLSKSVSIPLLFMAYYNTVFVYGVEKFCKDAGKAGAQGLIIPDMPLEEEKGEHFLKFCKKYKLATIRVVSPVSTSMRLLKNARIANGFVYCTARQGTTGEKHGLDPKLTTYLKRVRKHFSLPITVGFGISKKEHLDSIRPYADIAVVGSALINVINRSTEQTLEKNVSGFLRELDVVH